MGFGKRLRTLRNAKGYSLDDLAERTGISRAYLWKLEKKPGSNPSLDRLERLAEALDTSVGELAASSKAVAPQEIPSGLAECQQRFNLSREDVNDLAKIRFRGGQPSSAEDWYLLYLQLKKSLGAGED